MQRNLSLVVAGLVLLAATPAAAQDFGGPTDGSLAVQKFNPITSPYGVFTVDGSKTASDLQLSGGLILNYSTDPLVLRPEQGDPQSIVEDQFVSDFVATLGLFDIFEIGLALPVYLINNAAVGDQAIEGATLGDLRLRPKFTLLNNERSPVGLALVAHVTLPTGDAEAFASSDQFSVRPGLVIDTKVGDLLLAANFAADLQGTRSFGNLEVGSELTYGLGAEYAFTEKFLLGAELYGSSAFNDFFAEQGSPLEGILGAKYRLPLGLNFEAGLGKGLVGGYGAPAYRVFGGVRWAEYNNDFDDDGILNTADNCPRVPEDPDGFEDEDGCPEDDNDQDKILDNDDACPNQPEDMDEYEDDDGCPDPDNDKDGLRDDEDACPNEPGPRQFEGCPPKDLDGDGLTDDVDQCPEEPEDLDGFEDEDGCPDDDNDKDGIHDAMDKCPNKAEDKDGFEDEDGCPDPDNDKDGILDAADKCPNEPETINGNEDEDGCPDKGKVLVVVTKDEIKILQRVYFDSGKSTIKTRSFSLLDQVALTLKAYPDIRKIEVQGHTDDAGGDESNLKLSDDRAKAVRTYLNSKGIDKDRLIPKGYGETTPAVKYKGLKGGKLKKAREQNRRVQFVIVK